MTPNSIMLFAAGFGTRMGTLTEHTPKPLLRVGDRPLIDYAIDLSRSAGITNIVANAHYHADQIIAYLEPRNIQISLETPQILDTGGGLRHALPFFEENAVLTMNTDTIWQGPNPIELLVQNWDPQKMDALLMCIPTQNASAHRRDGDFTILEDGRIARGPGVVYGGVQIIKTDGLFDISEPVFSLNMLWDRMIAANRCFAMAYPGSWCDVGHPAGIDAAEQLLSRADV